MTDTEKLEMLKAYLRANISLVSYLEKQCKAKGDKIHAAKFLAEKLDNYTILLMLEDEEHLKYMCETVSEKEE